MTNQEIKANAPDGATHYYHLTPYNVVYAKKYKFLLFFTEYAVWGDELGWIEFPCDADVNRLKPL